MKKFILILMVGLVFFSSPICFAKKKKAKKFTPKQKIEFVTRDRFILSGDLYVANPKTNKPLIICLHSFGLNAGVWDSFAQNMRLKGYNVLAMDIRGHGRSIYTEKLKVKSRFNFKQSDWDKMPTDVIESINYVKHHYTGINCNNTVMVGADLGATIAANAINSMVIPPEKIVLISPILEFKGLKFPLKSTKFYNARVLILSMAKERVVFNLYTKIPAIIKYYSIGGSGNSLIKANPSAKDEMINFIIN